MLDNYHFTRCFRNINHFILSFHGLAIRTTNFKKEVASNPGISYTYDIQRLNEQWLAFFKKDSAHTIKYFYMVTMKKKEEDKIV